MVNTFVIQPLVFQRLIFLLNSLTGFSSKRTSKWFTWGWHGIGCPRFTCESVPCYAGVNTADSTQHSQRHFKEQSFVFPSQIFRASVILSFLSGKRGVAAVTTSRFDHDFQYLKEVGKGAYGCVIKCRFVLIKLCCCCFYGAQNLRIMLFRSRIDGCLYAVKKIKRRISGITHEYTCHVLHFVRL